MKHSRSDIALTLAACAVSLAAGRFASAAEPSAVATTLQNELTDLAAQARPGTLGITVSDLQSGKSWRVNAGRAYPMMSVFKAPLGATVLSQVDQRKISLGQTVIVSRRDLMTGAVSQIAATFHGNREVFTVRQLLAAAVSHSDNTAADVLLRLVGGPGVVTSYLRAHGIAGMRVDRDEKGIALQFQRQGYEAYLRDPRDRATPDAAALFLRKLWRGELLSTRSTRHLLSLLYGQTIPDRLRAGIPPGVRLADKCGTSATIDGTTAAFNDIGILTWPDGHTVIVAAFLTASRAPASRRNALFRGIAEALVADLQATPKPARYDRGPSSSSRIGHSGR